MSKITTLFSLLFLSLGVFAQVEYNMQNKTVTDCSGILYDSGGPEGYYGPNEYFTFTICPEPTPVCIQLDMGTVFLENVFDEINIYDGDNINAPYLLYHNSGVQTIPIVEAKSGCVTIEFDSDASDNSLGWRAEWQCFSSECPTIDLPPNEGDCLGAIVVCQELNENQESRIGEGAILNEIHFNNTCLLNGEQNSIWYKINIKDSGDLAFSIIPNNLEDDYDWAVFNLTDADCEEVIDNPNLLVSCNYSSDFGITGATGATNQTSGHGQGFNQNAMIPVKKGEVYFLHIGQFTASIDAFYTLDFTATTARIGEEIPPSIGDSADFVEVITPYIFRLTFSEAVDCESIEAMNLEIIGHSLTNHTICDGANLSTEFIYSISPPLDIGNHVLKIDGLLKDGCGNSQILNENVDFEVDVSVDIDPTLQSKLHIYPNPTTETFFVELPQLSSKNILIEVYNIEGKQLQSLPILNQKTVAIDVSNYPKGIYYLKVNAGDSHWTEKVVVR